MGWVRHRDVDEVMERDGSECPSWAPRNCCWHNYWHRLHGILSVGAPVHGQHSQCRSQEAEQLSRVAKTGALHGVHDCEISLHLEQLLCVGRHQVL